ncbi:hypothetical protein [Pseudomonas sp. 1928-m]|uniref:hypothetical protein n=1 Tax=Pseudomonas sp. 1928-m TaxID=3033804 RepID=UPI0023DF6CFC|nr:hypothetical protein [Pseudomonas sp. 1928-m]MDF3195360.1 hypothetical protein [Pseudomonas sp. 1928-m]
MHSKTIERIISGNTQLAKFWSSSHGWAPKEAAELMSKSRLDWQVELSKTLQIWSSLDSKPGELILAWANLGALVEGTLKLFLSVFYQDYSTDEFSLKNKGKLVDPDVLALEKLRQFFIKKQLLDQDDLGLIEKVQQRRNAIHAFKDRPIGTESEFLECVNLYLEFLVGINNRLPYPDDCYRPQF